MVNVLYLSGERQALGMCGCVMQQRNIRLYTLLTIDIILYCYLESCMGG